MTYAEEFLRPHRAHFAAQEYAPAKLASYIAGVIKQRHDLLAEWQTTEQFLEGMLQVSYRDVRGYTATSLMPGRTCCGEFMGLEVAFGEATDDDRRAQLIEAGRTWFARHADCSAYEQKAAAYRNMKEQHARSLAEAARRRQRQQEQAARELALKEAEEERKRRHALLEAQRKAAKRREQVEASADTLAAAIVAAAEDGLQDIACTHMEQRIVFRLPPHSTPELALIGAARQLRRMSNLPGEERRVLFDRLVAAAEERVTR